MYRFEISKNLRYLANSSALKMGTPNFLFFSSDLFWRSSNEVSPAWINKSKIQYFDLNAAASIASNSN